MAKTKLIDSIEFPAEKSPLKAFVAVGAIGILLSLVGLVVNTEQFMYSYLTSFAFFISFALASLFLVMIHHITRSSWGITIRRIPETFSSQLWIYILLFIPILLGMNYLYAWTGDMGDRHPFYADLLDHKSPYLNTAFFIVRNIIYFAVWSFLGYKLYQYSIKMDETGDWGIDNAMRKISAPGILLFGFTVAFASFDWLMSLRFDWFSTMWGVYYFAMSFQALFAFLILIVFYLHSKGLLLNTVTKAHIGDMGGWMFGFTVFYAYIAFSQYFLIYYATIPEETLWFYVRFEDNWSIIAAFILFGRFIIPFIVLLGRPAKSNFKVLKFVTVLILVSHLIEVFWIVMPTLHADFKLHWIDIATFLGFAGIFLGLFFYQFSKNSMIPKNDPKLAESLNKH